MDKLKASSVIEIDDIFIDRVAEKLAEREQPKKTQYTPDEVAELTPHKVETIRAHIRSKKLKAIWRGRGYIVLKKDLDEYLYGKS